MAGWGSYSNFQICGIDIGEGLGENEKEKEKGGSGESSAGDDDEEEEEEEEVSLDRDIEVLREGMPDRGVWLAGEHTAPFVALGTVTGAWWSGEAVAGRVGAAYCCGGGEEGRRGGEVGAEVDAGVGERGGGEANGEGNGVVRGKMEHGEMVDGGSLNGVAL